LALTHRENYLRTVRFEGPEWIPIGVGISGASWAQWREQMEEVVLRHPTIFPGFEKGKMNFEEMQYGPAYREGELYTDNWGCVWDNLWAGLEGQVKVHPLADDAALDTYKPPDPLTQSERGTRNDWEETRRRIEEQRAKGELTWGGSDRFYERLHFLRGFERFMMDVALETPQLPRLIDLVLQYDLKLVRQWLAIGVEVMGFGDDLGSQTQAMVSPKSFRKWLAPAYAAMMQPCRAAGCEVNFHCDGYIMELIPILRECGVTVINPQDLCNGIDDLAREVKGKMCIALDIDRQRIVPFGNPGEIRELIREEVMKLGSPAGGLTFVCGIYPPTPPENVDALCSALEEFRAYWWE